MTTDDTAGPARGGDTDSLPPGAVFKGGMGGGMAGGYAPMGVSSKDIKAIAEFDMKKLNANKARLTKLGLEAPVKIVKVKSALMQVVAGKNYKLTLAVKDASGKKASLEVITFLNLKGLKQITSVTMLGGMPDMGGSGKL